MEKQLSSAADGIADIYHHDPRIRKILFLPGQVRTAPLGLERVFWYPKIALQVVGGFQKVLQYPGRIGPGIPAGQVDHLLPGHGKGGFRKARLSIFPGFRSAELLDSRRLNPGRDESDNIRLFLRQLNQRPP